MYIQDANTLSQVAIGGNLFTDVFAKVLKYSVLNCSNNVLPFGHKKIGTKESRPVDLMHINT